MCTMCGCGGQEARIEALAEAAGAERQPAMPAQHHRHHDHQGDHGHTHAHGHDHGDLAAAIRGIVAARGAIFVALEEWPGVDGGALVAALAEAVPRMVVAPVPRPLDRGLDPHDFLHLIERDFVPAEGVLIARVPAIGPGAGNDLGADHRVLVAGAETVRAAAADFPHLLRNRSLIVAVGDGATGALAAARVTRPALAGVAIETAKAVGPLARWIEAASLLRLAAQ